MPEFEENKPNPNLHEKTHRYQPSKGKGVQENRQESNKETTSVAPSSNMRGRWKRPSRSNVSKTISQSVETNLSKEVKEPVHKVREERSFSPNEDYEIEDYENEDEETQDQEYEQEQKQITRNTREEHSPRTHNIKKPVEQKAFKPTSRKDVFIPKTKQDSERYRRDPSIASRKPSLWRKILAFFGLATPIRKRSTESRPHSRTSDSPRGPRHYSQNRRPYQQKRHPGQQRHRSGPSHKQDQKSND